MEYRRLGETKLAVSAITFGAWAAGGWMWGGNDDKEAIDAMKTSYDLGITSIDTAPIYGQGKSEELVGRAIKGIPRDKVQILTKYGMRWDLNKGQLAFKSKDNNGKDIDIYKYSGKESIITECENSLKRLGTDYIDLYQIHWPDAITPIDETMEAVIKLKEQGKIREAGVSNYDIKQMAIAEKTIKLASNQVPFSMVNRGIEDDLISYCIENKKAILAYSPLERGLLTGKIKPGHKFDEGDHRTHVKYFKDENIKRTNEFLAKIKPLADEKNATLGQLVIRWTINHPGITIALVGARNAQQAKQNARAIEIHINGEEMEYINNQLSDLEIDG
jgi:aryl-alcohol dehydrogenase-like predicted oxidoreductase